MVQSKRLPLLYTPTHTFTLHTGYRRVRCLCFCCLCCFLKAEVMSGGSTGRAHAPLSLVNRTDQCRRGLKLLLLRCLHCRRHCNWSKGEVKQVTRILLLRLFGSGTRSGGSGGTGSLGLVVGVVVCVVAEQALRVVDEQARVPVAQVERPVVLLPKSGCLLVILPGRLDAPFANPTSPLTCTGTLPPRHGRTPKQESRRGVSKN